MTGEYNPAGRLPNTWPKSLNDVPPITNYTMVGRTYRYSTAAPLYPFGYGLSYTTFSYSGLQVPGQISTKDDLSVKVTVENTGKAGGDEVVQVYVKWMNATDVPQLQLVAVQRTNIAMGQKSEVSLTVPNRWLSVLDKNNQWVVEPGTITVYVGGQQPDQTPKVPSNVLQVNVHISQ
jgi:beta-glucosidase